MISSLLIANRGEIACRIIRTCRRLGIRTIAVFSSADADALHVKLADEKHYIGPPEARSSYLDAERILAAAVEHRAEAIHPGYGFLAEKTDLPELCARHGLIWVGPSARCIELMGSKIAAKRLAREAGVRGVPGYDGEDQSASRLMKEARAIGFPLLIKASAGGGGKGMRRVHDAESFKAALEAAKREAKAAFGDDRVLLERYVVRPRHLEVQLAGDKHGNLVHLCERECSIQRNYQKIVEEAPTPQLSARVREKLFDAALRLGRAIGYDSLGTVEFLLHADQGEHTEPYFLEMNTRLQVEYPVTEAITGLDLVELQLRIAAGERLPITQEQVEPRGHAIEVRLTAEDPAADYRPEIGRIELYREPPAMEGVRIDSGICAGSSVTPYYDSMMAKVIAHDADRTGAARRLQRALERFVVLGVQTNRALLARIVESSEFLSGRLSTRFIPETFPDGFQAMPPDPPLQAIAALAAVHAWSEDNGGTIGPCNPWQTLVGFRVLERAGHPHRVRCQVRWRDTPPKPVTLSVSASGRVAADVDGTKLELHASRTPEGFLVRHADRLEEALCKVDGESVYCDFRGRTEKLSVVPAVSVLAQGPSGKQVERPHVSAALTGTVVSVDVQLGQAVTKGQVLVVMEAMKLVHTIVAPISGSVARIHCAPGQIVTSGARLIDIDPLADQASGQPGKAS